MSSITESNKIEVPYKDLERQISDLNENKAYVTHAEPVNQLDEKSNWNIYWRTSSFIETVTQETCEIEKLTTKSITTINDSKEELDLREEGPSLKTKKITYFIRHLFKRVRL